LSKGCAWKERENDLEVRIKQVSHYNFGKERRYLAASQRFEIMVRVDTFFIEMLPAAYFGLI